MNLNPVFIIPTYWSSRRSAAGLNRDTVYDRTTSIDKQGNLARCLKSLRKVNGLTRVIVLVVAEGGVENQATEKVRAIASEFSDMNIAVVSQPEVRHVHRYIDQMGLGALAPCASLKGYGAIHNMGILVASIFGHDTCVFLSENAIVDRADFLERAVYGLGAKTPSGTVITAKSGYLVDVEGDPLSKAEDKWFLKSWDKSAGYNSYIQSALKGSRLSRATTANSGCLVLHADAFGSVSFDPFITRGEDVDYVLSCRMYNIDIWLDNQLDLMVDAPASEKNCANFEQDMRRWFYEVRKIEFAKAQIDLMQVDPRSMEPYPGSWLTPKVSGRAMRTGLMGAIGSSERGEYLRVALSGRKEASKYARDNCSRFFEFQRQWPALVRNLWDCTPLATQLSGARSVQSGAAAFTGRFSSISTAE